ncbi:MAG: hypothetical protein GX937_15380 [Lentisphaerae bacterium]|jgi:hypothetical protein|nr:hypothetical protein [Lentisphaerota bacterium]
MQDEIHVWMPMIGFERTDPDCGAARVLRQMGFTPRGISAFLFHADIVHHHDGMAQEKTLPPDNCSYYASPSNDERERQDWTNFDLRTLVQNLAAAGVEPYLGIMGVYLGNRWHREWLSDHPEVMCSLRTGSWSLNVLKRLADGTYYEDFFADQLCATLTDYGFAGLQVADNFCPQAYHLAHGDFSADMLKQFLDYTGRTAPAQLEDGMDDESLEMRCLRGDWLWGKHRLEWIEFHVWRWNQFWRKIGGRLHQIGRKAIALGMYCTDPFETLYCKGLDLKGVVEAGLDYLMPNIVPTGLHMQHADWGDRFHRYMALAPLTAAYVPEGKALSLLGVRDATEEWDVIHHFPCRLERDIYTLLGFHRQTPQGLKRCLTGLMICLGDGIRQEEWKWLRERFEIGFIDGISRSLAPTLVWSDAALRNTLPVYIETRRWTLHKTYYEMGRRGALCGAVVRTDELASAEGALFVPNFDLLDDSEKKALASYRRGPVVATAAAEFDLAAWGIAPEVQFTDPHADRPLTAFAFNSSLTEADQTAFQAMADEADDSPDLTGDLSQLPEVPSVLRETLTFTKVSIGFRKACAELLKKAGNAVFTCNLPMVPMLLDDGRYRLYITNYDLLSYGFAVVTAPTPLRKVDNVSKYLLLPVKYLKSPEDTAGFAAKDSTGVEKSFRVKVAPGGLTIVDVTL